MERLDKFISNQTGISRSDVKTLVRKGAVAVNGVVVKNSDVKISPDTDNVLLNGKNILYRKHIYNAQ